MYHVQIAKRDYQASVDVGDYTASEGYFTNKRDVIRFIASEGWVSQRSIQDEVLARVTSTVKRDHLGWRAYIYYNH